MRIVPAALFAAVSVYCPAAPAGAAALPAAVDSLVRAGVVHTLHQQYDSAAAVYTRLAGTDSTTAAFFRTVTEYTRLTDHEDFSRDSVFTAWAGRAEQLVTASAHSDTDAMALYMNGTLAGYRGLVAIKQGSWVRGLRHGLRSMKLLDRAVAADSTLADAYWSLGLYRFYSGKMSARFSWLPFVDAGTDAALGLVRYTIAHGMYAREAARLALGWVYYDEKRFDDAAAEADSLLARYPANRMFMWLRGDALFAAGRNRDALGQFRVLQDALASRDSTNIYHRALCRWKRIQLLFRLDDDDAARAELDTLLAIPMDARTRERFRPFREKAEKMRDTAHAAYGNKR